MKPEALTFEKIEALLDVQKTESTVATIYIPTHPKSTPAHQKADRIRFKNALQSIEKQLSFSHMSEKEQKGFMRKSWDMYNDAEFWLYQSKGLAVFMTSSATHAFTLHVEVEELDSCGDTFILTPLIIAKDIFPAYYVLDLNLQQPRLFHADIQGLSLQEVSDMPKNLLEALNITDFEQELQSHSIGKGSTMLHGHGAAKDKKDVDIHDYLRLVDKAVIQSDILGPNDTLLIAGAVNHTALYRKISQLSQRVVHTIEGNFAGKEGDLERKVREYISSAVHDSITAFERVYNETNPLKKRSFSAPELLGFASRQGKIKTLAVGLLEKTNGSVRHTRDDVYRVVFKQQKDALLQLEAVVQDVLASKGTIVAVFPDSIDSRSVHALLRYA